jgi:Protein of unknown function (DUF3237)
MLTRRDMFGAFSVLGCGLDAAAAAAESVCSPGASAPALPAGTKIPAVQFVYECEVTLSDVQDFGATLEGHRRIIPITGGTFAGPEIRGQVVSGGADWNLVRTDGTSSVEAAYYLRTDDGVTIRIINKGVSAGTPVADNGSGERFFMFTAPTFEAPTGKYDWMNRAVFVATLGAHRDAKNAVLIRVFKLV